MPLEDKALKYFTLNGASGARLAAPNPDWAPVITRVDCSVSAAADINVFLGGTKASLTVNPTGANNTFVVTALRKGNCGENITVEVVENGLSTALSVDVTVVDHSITDVDIVVNLATDGAGNGTSTAIEVANAINADPVASKYVFATAAITETGAISEDIVAAPLAGATPTEVVEHTLAGAGQVFHTGQPMYVGTGGDDVEVTATAGTLDANIGGYWIQGVDQGRPVHPTGRPLAVSAA